jgi:hypothetical protein
VTWTENTGDAAFSPRSHLGATALNGQIFMTGCVANVDWDGLGDVRASSDGATWRRGHYSRISFWRDRRRVVRLAIR